MTDKSKESQLDLILRALKKGKSLTTIDALREFGSFRLGARIYDIKQMGYNIVTRKVRSKNGKLFASYKLVK